MEDSYRSPPIVMDTNVLVAGCCRRESSLAYRLLLGVLEERFPIILTEPIVLEYLDVLARPAVRRLTGLTRRQSEEPCYRFDFVVSKGAVAFFVATEPARRRGQQVCGSSDSRRGSRS